MATKPFVIAIVGPTASGKSELAVQIAKKLNGEIISADSRQVYRGMDIGTGKVEGKWRGDKYFYKSIRHYGLDITNPRTQYSVAKFQNYAKKAIAEILAQGKVPIICGGTGYWTDSVLFDQSIPAVKPNPNLRKKLEKLSATLLFTKLKKLDPTRAQNIDAGNPRRLIRALEIIIATGKPIPALSRKIKYDVLWLGITHDKTTLDKRIDKRLDERLKLGMIKEVKKLRASGLSWKRLEDFGLEYKFIAQFLQKKFTESEMRSLLSTAIKQYAKRQITWFKRNKDIQWIKNVSQALSIIKKHHA
ncbi:MAG: tRNA (adenosine(37)-N6)-dimethylallyltransferase MiaA [Candidatus Doudnabacteria bacterium]|nr:tRNA (adenosine(37)-N6)-dimethylallyltransferase MiaA [Candidatus Doudnabacteria bacterium]